MAIQLASPHRAARGGAAGSGGCSVSGEGWGSQIETGPCLAILETSVQLCGKTVGVFSIVLIMAFNYFFSSSCGVSS